MKRMILRTLAVLLLSAAASVPMSAQQQRGGGAPGGTITGTVIDSITSEPLVAVTVAVLSARDSSIVTGTIGQKDGTFSVAGLRPGRYFVRVTYIGYLRRQIDGIEIRLNEPTVALGTIAIRPDPNITSDVVISAKKRFMQVGIDRTTYQTKDLLVASGGTATDLLRNIPSVEVDGDGNVNLRGSTNLVVQINGRPVMLNGASLATFLQGLPANSIERIEVIPNPSARYDPEGISGIINIVMKQDGGSRGFSGGVNGSLGTTGAYNIGGNVSYGDGPWNVFANYGFNHGARLSNGNRLVRNELDRAIERTISGDTGSRMSHVFNTSIDYAISPAHSLFVSGVFSSSLGNSHGGTITTSSDAAGTITGNYDRLSGGTSDDIGIDGRIGYKWTIAPTKQELSVEGRYSRNSEDERNDYTQRDLLPSGAPAPTAPGLQRTVADELGRSASAQADYFMPLFDGKLEAGYKGELQLIDNGISSESFDQTRGEFMPDAQINNRFSYDQMVHAGYLQFGREFGPVGVQLGLRGEDVVTNFNLELDDSTYNNRYNSLFPSAFLTYKPYEDLQLKGSYSRRINRPRTGQLNPFTSFDNPRMKRTGNPALKPEYTNAFEFGITHFTDITTLTIAPFYRETIDAIRRLEFFDTTGVATVTFVNFDRNTAYGADVTGTIRLGDAFSGMLSFSGYQSLNDASNIEAGMGVETFTWSLRGNISAQLPWDLETQLTYFYRAPMEIEGGQVDAHQMADIALQAKLFEGRGRVGLRVSDPLKGMGFSVSRTDGRYYQESHFTWNSRAMFLTFSYNFGAPVRAPRRDRGTQNTGSDDPMGGM